MNVKREIAYELHKPARRIYPRRHVFVKGFRDLFQADLCDLSKHSEDNDEYKYILTIIDVFSKYGWAQKLKTKTGKEVAEAFSEALNSCKKKFLVPPKFLQIDRGSEFYSEAFREMLVSDFEPPIQMYSSFSNLKASVCERWNRTLKTKMYREFSANGSYRWIDILDDLVHDYNSRVHRTIKMAPNKVKLKDENFIRSIHDRNHEKAIRGKVRFHIGDWVRISKLKGVFEKGYTPNYSTELFRIVEVCKTCPVTYKLEDYYGKPIKGGFYNEEISKTAHPDFFLVEKVLEEKGNKVYVKYLGLPKKENSWINKKDLYD